MRPQIAHVQIPVPFGQAPPCGTFEQGNMAISRDGVAQLFQQPNLPGGGGEEVPSPHHPVHPHPSVVLRHRQLIGVNPIGPPENKVPAVPVQPLLLGAKHLIHKGNDLSRHLDAPGGRTAALLEGGFFLERKITAPAGIDSGAVGGVGGRGGQTLLPAAIAGIDQPPAGQRFKRRLVERGPAALTIGRLPRPPAQVPVQSQPD